ARPALELSPRILPDGEDESLRGYDTGRGHGDCGEYEGQDDERTGHGSLGASTSVDQGYSKPPATVSHPAGLSRGSSAQKPPRSTTLPSLRTHSRRNSSASGWKRIARTEPSASTMLHPVPCDDPNCCSAAFTGSVGGSDASRSRLGPNVVLSWSCFA